MTGDFPVALFLILGAALVPLFRGAARTAWMLLLPVAAFAYLLAVPQGNHGQVELLGQTLVLMRVDKLSLLFGYIFLIATLLSVVYALHVDDVQQHVAGLVYAGSAIGAVFAGDLISLFLYWEITAVSSVLLIWARRGEHSAATGMRYVIVQLLSGMFLLAGGLMHWQATGSLEFGQVGVSGQVGGTAGALILIAFGIKSAFPLLHNWLPDAYPEATPTGTVFLSAFTTKLGIYALARAFPGTEMLIWVGTLMAAFPIFYAVIENDLRRVLAYSMNNQLGFMVVGIGIGSELAINGAVAHAFADILFKGLLFMSMGAVLLRTGTIKGSELGGLYKSMPWTAGFCMVGAASISAFPLFSGFVTKSMIMSAAAGEGLLLTWLVLLFASAGVFHHAGIKIPYFAFFAHDSGIRCAEAPRNMLVAMGIAAALCIGIGIFPQALYALLPFATDYAPYTASHIVAQLQLLFFSALAFAVLMRTGIYPPELRSLNLDSDWFYRKAATAVAASFRHALRETYAGLGEGIAARVAAVGNCIVRHRQSDGLLVRSWPTGSMALWVMVMLLAYLLLYYIGKAGANG
ncbi:MAG: Na(+)/H(+) antiporter subunit D [Sulfuritalea sp.]|nr:Na(+)/H(+) antiporter subunit D [Sulfuritalea sp.]